MPNEIHPPDQNVSRKSKGLELAVFLFLILPSALLSSFLVKPGNIRFSTVAVSTILQDLALLSLILFFLWRNGERFASIGLTFRNAGREAALGVGLFVPLMFAVGLLQKAMRAAGLSLPESTPSFLVPSGAAEMVLAFVLLAVIAVSEEVMFRGYLIHRLQALAGSPTAAVLSAAFIFSIGHAYQRSGGVIGVWMLGLLFGVIFLWRKSLIAPMTMHYLQNFVGIILLPLSQ